ncbi:MAG: YidC/Oxa1 family membrane protein insertase [Candidatus Caldatribacterium sp.]|nr:YidC/Oxa1 family membrane protein insertase [Candidatus Caldatribacterium sp.]MDW8081913.1 YidC/Oxa1 family membrane protein insertase [Candidatus Calescibacterium sp.]
MAMFAQIWDGLAKVMELVLRFFYQLTGNYGISIILLTVVVRLALYPVIHKQNLSARAMQEIQPEIKKLQEKYGKDPQRLNQEIMRLYREKGVNPLGGCLPLLIQLPFLFVLYRVLVTYDYGQAGFLWLPSLSRPDPYYILPLAMGATTFWQQKISTPPSSGEGAQQNLLLMVVMPVFLVFISWGLPSGVLLYWFVSNLFYIFQQYMLEAQLRRAKPASPTPTSLPRRDQLVRPQVKKGGERREKKR